VQDMIEEYQEAALRTWLAAARAGDAQAGQALRQLGDMLQQQHDDPWMNDFLGSRWPGDWQGEQALSKAITSNKQGLPTLAQDYAKEAEVLFRKAHNMPGVLRSRFETMYANQRLLESKLCLDQARMLEPALGGTRYHWLQIQTALTEGSCLIRHTQFEAAKEKLDAGAKDADEFQFRILQMRAEALRAGLERSSGKCDETWRIATAGLDSYWQGSYPAMRLHEFYSHIKQCLEDRKLWYAAKALQERLVTIGEKEVPADDQNLSVNEAARDHLQELLIELNERDGHEPARSATHSDPVFATYELPIKIDLAELQMRNNPQAALTTLEKAGSLVERIPDRLIRLKFYRVRGDVLLKLRQTKDAETAYAICLQIAEQARKTVSSRGQWAKETSEIYLGLVGVLLQQGLQKEALQMWEWYKSRLWDTDSGAASSVGESWREIESEILRVPFPSGGPNTRLIYAYVKDHLYIWTIGPAGLNMPQPVEISREKLQPDIDDYVQEIGIEDANPAMMEENNGKLFAALLAPAMPDVRPGSTVEVEPDPFIMKKLPLEALKSPEGWYFGQRYPVIYSPGIIKENSLRQFSLSLHLPVSGWLLNALTVSDQEITNRVPGIAVSNADGMTQKIFTDHMTNSEMFIFWGHGEAGGLRMPGRKPLQARDFPPRALKKLQLAAFLACSSGTGGDGIVDTSNLVHAMLSGGVPEVIASKWDVSRKSTEQMLGSFYQHLMNGETPARAMLEARMSVFQAGTTNPYYWAAFTLNGKDH